MTVDARSRKLAEAHTPESIRTRLGKNKSFSYLGDAVLGAIDGCVTTFAVVSGVYGGGLSIGIAVLLGFANLLADGFSMAVSNYQRASSDRELIEKARKIEAEHIEWIPEGETEEIRQIFEAKGFRGAHLEKTVETITRNRQLWIDTMLTEEWGLPLSVPLPWKSSLVTFAAFLLVGTIPLLPFIILLKDTLRENFIASAALTLTAFFLVGAAKGKVLKKPWWSTGLKTAFFGGVAAALAFFVGFFLKGIL